MPVGTRPPVQNWIITPVNENGNKTGKGLLGMMSPYFSSPQPVSNVESCYNKLCSPTWINFAENPQSSVAGVGNVAWNSRGCNHVCRWGSDFVATVVLLHCTVAKVASVCSHCSRLNQFCLDQLLPTRRSLVATGCRGIKATIKTGAISYFHPGMQKRNTLEGIEIRHRAKICLSQAIAVFSSRADWIARNPN